MRGLPCCLKEDVMKKEILELAGELELPGGALRRMEDVMERLLWERMEPVVGELTDPGLAEEAQQKLAELVAAAEEGSGMGRLAGMLAAACRTRQMYGQWGIPDSIFLDTMRCFPRFLRETKQITGEWIYDRSFWTWRQTSGLLFRLGTLEFEYAVQQGAPVLSVHIPSDAGLTEDGLCKSYEAAGRFWTERREALCFAGEPKEIWCSTWLLSPELGKLLPPGSGIRRFASGYELTQFDPDNESFYRWLFEGKRRPEELPGRTSLQRAVKAHLAAGGTIGIAAGYLRRTEGS